MVVSAQKGGSVVSVIRDSRNETVFGGPFFAFLETWSLIFNYTVSVLLCDSYEPCQRGHFVGERVNRSWGGLMSFIDRGDADLVAYAFAPDPNRSQIIDLLYPLYETGLSLLVPSHLHSDVERRMSLDMNLKWSSWGLILAFQTAFMALTWCCCKLGWETDLSLGYIESVLLLFYRKFIAQRK